MSKPNFITYHRGHEAREVIDTYPEPMRSHCLRFWNHKVHAQEGQNGIYLECTTSAHEIKDTYMRLDERSGESGQTGWRALSKASKSGVQLSKLEEHATETTSFYGLKPEAFKAELDGKAFVLRDRFKEACAELEKSGLKHSLEQAAAFKKKRRRTLSEHDGDLDLERIWDTKPFMHTEHQKKEFPIVELIFPIVNSAGMGARSISQFGARCLALADLLEKHGYRVAITAENWCKTADPTWQDTQGLGALVGIKKDAQFLGQGVRYVVRSANDYGDISSMALFGSAEFYRRVVFNLDYECSHFVHALGKESRNVGVQYGYGYPIYERPVPLEPGQIFLTESIMQEVFSNVPETAQKMFEERILWQLRVKKEQEAATA